MGPQGRCPEERNARQEVKREVCCTAQAPAVAKKRDKALCMNGQQELGRGVAEDGAGACSHSEAPGDHQRALSRA